MMVRRRRFFGRFTLGLDGGHYSVLLFPRLLSCLRLPGHVFFQFGDLVRDREFRGLGWRCWICVCTLCCYVSSRFSRESYFNLLGPKTGRLAPPSFRDEDFAFPGLYRSGSMFSFEPLSAVSRLGDRGTVSPFLRLNWKSSLTGEGGVSTGCTSSSILSLRFAPDLSELPVVIPLPWSKFGAVDNELEVLVDELSLLLLLVSKLGGKNTVSSLRRSSRISLFGPFWSNFIGSSSSK